MKILIEQKTLLNGFSLPVFGLGTYGMGGDSQRNPDNNDEKDIEAIKTAIELGVGHIDTAESYAEGFAEILISKAISKVSKKELFITSKIAAHHLNAKDIKPSVVQMLKRLQVEYLDLCLMHRCPEPDKFKECVAAMNDLVDEGLVKHIGLSNTNAEHTKQLCELSKYPFVVNQVHYNLQFREIIKDGLLEFCQKNNILIEAWRPVNKASQNKSGLDFTKSGINIVDQMCQKYQKTPAQIAINWLISQKNVTVLCKTSSKEHLLENLGALGWQMAEADVNRLANEFPDQKLVSDTVRLA